MLRLEIPAIGDADLVREGGNLLYDDDGLDAAVMISLFTDRRADPDDKVEGSRRGWWGDSIFGDQIGSRLWMLRRENELQTTLDKARQYALEALQWLVDDGVAKSVAVIASRVASGVLGLSVSIQRPDAAAAPYARLWEARSNAV